MKARCSFLYTLTLGSIFIAINSAPAQGTAFTYQGSLSDGGSQASGNYDLQFTVFDSTTNGNTVGGPVTNSATAVTNGLFIVTLDFGTGVFGGQPLWLEVGVRTNGGQDSFATLSPRQALTPAPYAITASNLSGTLPTSQLTGTLPTSQLSGTIPVSSVVGALPAGSNLVSNLTYTNYEGLGQALLPVTVGDTYVYYPTKVGGIYDGTYVLQTAATNFPDANAFFVDVGQEGFFGAFQSSPIFVATQSTVTFINANATTGPVTDALYDATGVVINGTLNGTGQFSGVSSGTFSGNVTNSTLAGNAQGGAVTNIDAAIVNLRDSGYNFAAAFVNWTNAGGVLYNPGTFTSAQSFTYHNTGAVAGNSGIASTPLTLSGNGPALSSIFFTGTNLTMFDSSAWYSPIGINFNGLYAFSRFNGNNNFYVSGIYGDSLLYWDNVELRQWNIGASVSQAGSEFDALRLDYNNIGLQMQTISDQSIINVLQSYGNNDAGLELDSRGANVHDNTYSDQIGVLIGNGGNDFVQTVTENDTNCTIAFGYPPWWPANLVPANNYSFPWPGNDVFIAGGSFGWGYVYANNPMTNANSGLSSYMKIWNAPISKVEIHSVSYTPTINYGPFVVSCTPMADNFTPFTFDGVLSYPAPLMQFSDGTSIPPEDGYHVGVNDPDLEFTKNVLEYSRDTNGNLYAAGNITSAGTLNASAAQVGSLNVTGVAANSLLGTDPGGNVTGITIGSGLALSGGTLSASLLGGPYLPAGTSINTYTADHTAAAQDGTILVNGDRLTITLPDAGALGAGRSYTIKLIAGSTATIATTGSQTIDGGTSYILSAQYKYVMVQSDGAQWWVLGNN